MKSILSAVAFIAAAVISASAVAFAQVPDLNQPWLAPGESLNAEMFGRILNVLRQDPETLALLQALEQKLGTSDLDQLIKIVRLIPVGQEEAGLEGYFTPKSMRIVLPNSPAWVPNSNQKHLNEIRAGSYYFHEIKSSAATHVNYAANPTICLRQGEPLGDTVVTFVHEMTHLLGFRPDTEKDVLRFPDFESYADAKLKEKGGEVEAFSANIRALERLRKNHSIQRHYEVERYFDHDGRVMDAAALSAYLLGIGYHDRFLNGFSNLIRHSRQFALDDSKLFLETWMRTAQENSRSLAQSIAQDEKSIQDAEAAQARGVTVNGLDEVRAQLADSVSRKQSMDAWIDDLQEAGIAARARAEEIAKRFPEYFK